MPEPVELTVSFSFGAKKNLGNYENADFHVSSTERWNVEGMTQKQIDKFYSDQFKVVKDRVMTKANAEWEALGG